MEDWNQFQFSFLGQNGLTEIKNAPQARIKGIESDISLRPDEHWTMTASTAYTSAKLAANYCGVIDPATGLDTDCPNALDPNPPQAPIGTQLPVTPKFKANALVRYEWPIGAFNAHIQGVVAYQDGAWGDLRVVERSILGRQKSFASVDLAAGIAKDNWTAEILVKNVGDTLGDTYRYAECAIATCGVQTYQTPIQPRTIAIRFGQRF